VRLNDRAVAGDEEADPGVGIAAVAPPLAFVWHPLVGVVFGPLAVEGGDPGPRLRDDVRDGARELGAARGRRVRQQELVDLGGAALQPERVARAPIAYDRRVWSVVGPDLSYDPFVKYLQRLQRLHSASAIHKGHSTTRRPSSEDSRQATVRRGATDRHSQILGGHKRTRSRLSRTISTIRV